VVLPLIAITTALLVLGAALLLIHGNASVGLRQRKRPACTAQHRLSAAVTLRCSKRSGHWGLHRDLTGQTWLTRF